MVANLISTLLGAGGRLFDGVGTGLHDLKLVFTIATPCVEHLEFARSVRP